MTAPPPPVPVEVPTRKPPPVPPPGANTSSGSKSPLAVLGTRNGQIGAAVVIVIGFALYRRLKNGTGTDTASTAAAGAGVPAANTTNSDLFSELEPLLENLSGFQDTATIEQQLATLQKGLGAGQTTGTGTTTPPASTPPGKDQQHAVGKLGGSYNLYNYVLGLYPKATGNQIAQIVYNTINSPANAKYHSDLVAGNIRGGSLVTFVSSPVK